MSGVCSTWISFILGLCLQFFHILNKLEPYVSCLFFYCFVYRSLVFILTELVVGVGPELVLISTPSNIHWFADVLE